MSKHLNPLEKEFPRWRYKSNSRIKMSNFCKASIFSFRTMFPHCTDDRKKAYVLVFLPRIAAERPIFPYTAKGAGALRTKLRHSPFP